MQYKCKCFNSLNILELTTRTKSVSSKYINTLIIKKKLKRNYNDLVKFDMNQNYLHLDFVLTW